MTTKTVTQAPLRIRDLVPWLFILAVLPVMFWHPARQLALVLAAAVVGLRLAVAIVRFAMLPSSAYPHYLPARWHRFRWHRLARNLGLAYVDHHLGGLDSRRPARVVYPKVRFLPDPFGWVVKTRLIPNVSRPEFEKAAEHLANAWSCHRVGITQPEPGRLLVRAMRRDPLAEPLSSAVLPVFDGRRLVLGRDEWGELRSVSLANLSGSVIGGNPGRGKTQFACAIAAQFAPSSATQWYVLDGKNGGDWSGWADRAIGYAGDNLADAVGLLEDAHARMVKRLATVVADLGTRNAWRIGPTAAYPLVWLAVDECSQYLDLEGAKSLGKDAERQVRQCRALLTQMLRKGRSVMFHVSLVAQKATSTSIPTDMRDLAGLRACFGVQTLESGIAVLGEDLRRYESASPTLLQGEEYAGVATVRLATGADPYTRIRVPFVDEDQADNVARQTASLRERPERACVACVGDGGSCERCKGTGVDPDITAPVLTAV
jgi:DNA segregation ATPase FtsK/SpoIIIE, S-DNA-T family